MSNYLTNLVTTHLNLSPTLQPRVASFFEPTASGEYNAGARELYTPVHETREPPAAPPARLIAAPETPGAPRPDHAPGRGETERVLRPNETPPSLAEPTGTRSRDDLAFETNSEMPGEPEQPSNPKLVPPTPPVEPAHARAVIVQPRVKRMVEPFSVERAPEPAAPPIIRVSIGRILVRAGQAAPERTPPRSPAPKKMSLEEYLAKRERGEP